MDISKLTVEESVKQCSKPTGDIGIEYGQIMNKHHESLLKWGLPLVLEFEKNEQLVILDVGCGAGLAIKLMAEAIPESKIMGIDYSDEMVESAKKLNEKSVDCGNVIITRGSVEKLPFEDNKFDVITATETIYFWPNLAKNLKEVYRTLKTNGSFAVINETYYREGCELQPHYKAILESDYAIFPSENNLLDLFKSAGFKDIKINKIPSEGWITVCGTKRVD
ncbi:MAG: class I SAM-dependent methyltransferase [bacterium]|nr:class I SAM-dependent methyltransferase [bacterium]